MGHVRLKVKDPNVKRIVGARRRKQTRPEIRGLRDIIHFPIYLHGYKCILTVIDKLDKYSVLSGRKRLIGIIYSQYSHIIISQKEFITANIRCQRIPRFTLEIHRYFIQWTGSGIERCTCDRITTFINVHRIHRQTDRVKIRGLPGFEVAVYTAAIIHQVGSCSEQIIVIAGQWSFVSTKDHGISVGAVVKKIIGYSCVCTIALVITIAVLVPGL